MRAIRSSGTKPEIVVRKMVHGLGFRYRLHSRDLPGKPDIVLRSRRKAVFVHGCFWHQHDNGICLDGRTPKSNTGYWSPKLARNVQRDAEHVAALKAAGWRILIVWDCETKNDARLRKTLVRFLT